MTCTLAEDDGGRSLLTSTREVGYLILYLWVTIPSEWDIFGRFFEVVVNGFSIQDFRVPWCSALESFFASEEFAYPLLVKCCLCLRKPDVPGNLGLAGVLQVTQCLVDVCPPNNAIGSDTGWMGLLLAISLACAREYCHSLGKEEELNLSRTVIPLSIEIAQCVV